MPTTEELLAQLEAEAQSETPVCVIDPETRTITVPPEYQLLGVENDKRVERILFRCPKIVGDNQDLSQDYILFVNYVNANGDPDAYKINDMQVEGDNITFSWLLEEKVTLYQGDIQISFCGIIPGDEQEDPDKNRWGTTINTDCTVLTGLKCTQQAAESNPDALAQIWAAIDELRAGGGASGKDGREVELKNNGTAIQWRYVGDSSWTDLVQLSELKGEKGDKGDHGDKGEKGADGVTPTIGENGNWYIGEEDTGKPSRGEKGDPGDKGDTGQTGATPNIQIGEVTTLEPGEQATASITGTPENPLLNLGIPKGEKGDPGEDAESGSPATPRQEMLERSIENYYALRRTGKIYQTKIWKFAANPTSAGEKLMDNAGLVFEPSTDVTEGQDDYLNGQNPLFEWVNCNYIRDDDGTARPTAIEGTDNYQTTGAVDVGAMQMSFWWRWDTSSAEYDLITISDLPHPELGLKPWPECVKADGTVMPWCIGSKYISGIASDGKLRSQPGLKPERKQSHNNMITNYQAKGEGYWGAGAVRNTFQIKFNIIKGATKSYQALYAGCTSYSFQYEAAVQSEEAHTYFPVTNAQANSIVVGGYVSVGYGYSTGSTISNDRGYDSVHAYADSVKVLSIEDLDENNKAVYLDIPEEDAFDTMPHVYSESLSAPVILTSIHYRSGATDAVRGRHDGSPGSNTNGKYPYRVQGREYAVGAYIVASDTVIDLQSDFTKHILVAPKGAAHSSSDATIRSTYERIGTMPAAAAGNNADWWIGDCGFDNSSGTWYPSAEGSGSAQGYGDRVYAGGSSATSGTREYLQGGSLSSGSSAGSAFLSCGSGLGNGGWGCVACD